MGDSLTFTTLLDQVDLWALAIFLGYSFYYVFSEQDDEASAEGKKKMYALTRAEANPVLSPREHLGWENQGVFNPAAVKIGDTIHLLYRAVGGDGVSRVGYATSKDGVSFNGGDTYPAFSFERTKANSKVEKRYDPVMYPSGGSYGGCEDPRITHIGDTVYMTFNAFDGWDFIRIGLTMIKEKDFLEKKWHKWSKPILLSPPGQIHKNWMIFPEKINGKFAILHSISPRVEIEYRDSLSDIGINEPFIESPVGERTSGRKEAWDTRIRSAGPPPLKTKKGWLVLYHANQGSEPHKYKLGAQLLDLHDPKKKIAQCVLPVLEPDSWYENDGKPGIVYACGAIIKEKDGEDMLYVYYGGGDKYVCAAYTHLNPLLNWLIIHGAID